MGCDGGTIPKRHELVKGPKKVEQVDKNAALVALWKYCALSQVALKRPIVSCELGRLYNKDAIIEYLLDKSPEKCIVQTATHIKSLKDVKELNLTPNPSWKGDEVKGDKYDDLQLACFICPVVGLEMNGRHKFCYLRSCGCVFSDRALKEIKAEVCYKCGESFQKGDVIFLNGSKDEMEILKKGMEERKLKAKLERKAKKKSKPAATEGPSNTKPEEIPGPSNTKPEEIPDPSNTKPEETIPSEQRVSGSSRSVNGRPVPLGSGTSSAISSSSGKRSRADTGQKSEAYKSIFTSHSSAKRSKDQEPNWITHTAYYF